MDMVLPDTWRSPLRLRLAQTAEAHGVAAVVWRQAGDAVRHGVQVRQDGLVEETLQQKAAAVSASILQASPLVCIGCVRCMARDSPPSAFYLAKLLPRVAQDVRELRHARQYATKHLRIAFWPPA